MILSNEKLSNSECKKIKSLLCFSISDNSEFHSFAWQDTFNLFKISLCLSLNCISIIESLCNSFF